MLFFGHRFLENKKFYHISDIDSIINTPPNATLYLEFEEKNLDIIKHCATNNLPFALRIQTPTQLAYASALGAHYIIVKTELAKTAQSIAESYLFDAKILVNIESEDAIEEMLLLSIDGVIFANAIIKINS